VRHQMVVTDITRMSGRRVCVAGYLEDGTCVRPVCAGGPTEDWLKPLGSEDVTTFSVVQLDLRPTSNQIVAPHTEDQWTPASGHRVIRRLSHDDRKQLLRRTLSPNVRSIFGAEVHLDGGTWGRYVASGEGTRSLGTIQPISLNETKLENYGGKLDLRLRFTDATGEQWRLKVVDLDLLNTIRESLLSGAGDVNEAQEVVHDAVTGIDLFLRLGLTRHWTLHPDRCYLQITAVEGFPN
jgi:hypothetical protein